MNCDEAVHFLPDYLTDEVNQQAGDEVAENMDEFTPNMLFTEQVMRLFPREIAVRFKMYPAFEETLMRYQEIYDSNKAKNE